MCMVGNSTLRFPTSTPFAVSLHELVAISLGLTQILLNGIEMSEK